MKKNLAMSIALLFLAALTCCGVTFAYFSAGYSGSKNYISVGNFVFESSSTITNSQDFYFRAPTIINTPKIIDAVLPSNATDAQKTEYQTNHDIFLANGDDDNFDDYIIPINITITNKSMTDMRFEVLVTASKATGETTDYTANETVQSFVFDKATSESLATAPQYGDALRTACNQSTVVSSDIFTQTKSRIAEGKMLMNAKIFNDTLLATDISGNTPIYKTITLKAMVWLDYRGFKEIAKNATPARQGGKIIINVSVKAMQANVEKAI